MCKIDRIRAIYLIFAELQWGGGVLKVKDSAKDRSWYFEIRMSFTNSGGKFGFSRRHFSIVASLKIVSSIFIEVFIFLPVVYILFISDFKLAYYVIAVFIIINNNKRRIKLPSVVKG